MEIVFALSSVQWAVVVVSVVLIAGLSIGFYTRTGSGINVHPVGQRAGEDAGEAAPGAHGTEHVSGRDQTEVPDPQRGAR